jgi:hypothetical protein
MFESLLIRRNQAAPAPPSLLDLHFEDVALGTKTIVDRAQGITFTTLGAAASQATNFGVVDVAGVGRCFQFNAINCFHNPNNPLNNFSTQDYDLQLGILKPNTTPSVYIFNSGTYANVADPGSSVLFDQFTSTWFQVFLSKGDTTFQRNQGFGANPQTYQEFLIQKRTNGMTIKNLTTNAVQSFASFPVPRDTELTIGGHKTGNYMFPGYLKYLKLSRPTS